MNKENSRGGIHMKIKMFLAVLALVTSLMSCNSPEGPDGTENNESQQSILIQLDKTSFSFSAVIGQSNPPSQGFQLRNAGSGELPYQLTTTESWLNVSPPSGSSSGEWDVINISVRCQGMTSGSYTGEIKINCNDAMNSPQVISVRLKLTGTQNPPNPTSKEWTADTDFGGLDFTVSPTGNSIIKITLKFSNWKGRSGSIGVTNPSGWTISNRSFDIDIDLSDPLDPSDKEEWTIKGTFSISGDRASGTWRAVIGSSTYSGSWDGFPKTQ